MSGVTVSMACCLAGWVWKALETLVIVYLFPVPNRDVERQPMRMSIMTRVTLPNLRWFVSQGVSACQHLEEVSR
ncbi:hypothetical protein F5888DRAFT_1745656 [Russula emetica]|nr:hypothetical protein F5888DRAFT_1745656 [Russula emetica]